MGVTDDVPAPTAATAQLPVAHVRLMTALIVLLRIASHYDGGVLAALYGDSKKRFETDLDLTSTELGLIVTLGYIGLISGCVVSGFVMGSVPSKRLIQASGVFLMVGTAMFAAAQNVWMCYAARLVVGFGQSLQTVLYPVWADEFSPPGSASGYLAALQAGGPLGIVAGYVISGSVMANTGLGWRWCFLLQAFIMCIPMMIFLFVPKAYLNVQHRKRAQEPEPTVAAAASSSPNVSSNNEGEHDDAAPPPPPRHPLRLIMSDGVIWCATLVLSSLYFVVNGLQTWVTDYIVSPNSTIHASENTVVATFGVTAATAPVSGIILGGVVLAKLGGYRRFPSRACYAGLVEGVFATLFAYLSLVMTEFAAFMVCIWLVLFFGGAMVPGMVGIVVTSVDKKHRSLVSAFASFVYNLLGYALGPLAAGVAADQFENEDVGIVWGFRIVMGWSAIALLLQFTMCILWRSRGVAEPRELEGDATPLPDRVNVTPKADSGIETIRSPIPLYGVPPTPPDTERPLHQPETAAV